MLTIPTAGATMTSREIALKTKRSNMQGLYLCMFDQGTLKVGMGKDVASRLSAHKGAAAVFGIAVARTDIIRCDNAAKAEKMLIEWCGKNSTSCSGREWFVGVDYATCLEVARDIAISTMGPHKPHLGRRNLVDSLLAAYVVRASPEAAAYSEAREAMLGKSVSELVLEGLDVLHRESERVRQGVRMGCVMPNWFDNLNCFGAWEIEIWFDDGLPSAELLRAAADALGAISRNATLAVEEVH